MKLIFIAVMALLLYSCSAEKRVSRLNCPNYKFTGQGHDNWKKFVPKMTPRKSY